MTTSVLELVLDTFKTLAMSGTWSLCTFLNEKQIIQGFAIKKYLELSFVRSVIFLFLNRQGNFIGAHSLSAIKKKWNPQEVFKMDVNLPKQIK